MRLEEYFRTKSRLYSGHYGTRKYLKASRLFRPVFPGPCPIVENRPSFWSVSVLDVPPQGKNGQQP